MQEEIAINCQKIMGYAVFTAFFLQLQLTIPAFLTGYDREFQF